jgi:hypothetical protein
VTWWAFSPKDTPSQTGVKEKLLAAAGEDPSRQALILRKMKLAGHFDEGKPLLAIISFRQNCRSRSLFQWYF